MPSVISKSFTYIRSPYILPSFKQCVPARDFPKIDKFILTDLRFSHLHWPQQCPSHTPSSMPSASSRHNTWLVRPLDSHSLRPRLVQPLDGHSSRCPPGSLPVIPILEQLRTCCSLSLGIPPPVIVVAFSPCQFVFSCWVHLTLWSHLKITTHPITSLPSRYITVPFLHINPQYCALVVWVQSLPFVSHHTSTVVAVVCLIGMSSNLLSDFCFVAPFSELIFHIHIPLPLSIRCMALWPFLLAATICHLIRMTIHSTHWLFHH